VIVGKKKMSDKDPYDLKYNLVHGVMWAVVIGVIVIGVVLL
jgi:hypothetical protein